MNALTDEHLTKVYGGTGNDYLEIIGRSESDDLLIMSPAGQKVKVISRRSCRCRRRR